MPRLSALLPLLLLGCTPPQAAPAPTPPSGASSSASVRLDLAGDYRIVRVNGEEAVAYDRNDAPQATIGSERIHFRSQCIYNDWAYETDGQAITTRGWTYPDGVAMCARALSPQEEAIEAAFAGARSAVPTRSGWRIDGPGGTLELERIGSATGEIAGRDNLTGQWHIEQIDGRPLRYPLALEADGTRIWWEPVCAGQYSTYVIDGVGFRATPHDPAGTIVCKIGIPPNLPSAWSALAAVDTIEWVNPDAVTLTAGERSITLIRRAPSE